MVLLLDRDIETGIESTVIKEADGTIHIYSPTPEIIEIMPTLPKEIIVHDFPAPEPEPLFSIPPFFDQEQGTIFDAVGFKALSDYEREKILISLDTITERDKELFREPLYEKLIGETYTPEAYSKTLSDIKTKIEVEKVKSFLKGLGVSSTVMIIIASVIGLIVLGLVGFQYSKSYVGEKGAKKARGR